MSGVPAVSATLTPTRSTQTGRSTGRQPGRHHRRRVVVGEERAHSLAGVAERDGERLADHPVAGDPFAVEAVGHRARGVGLVVAERLVAGTEERHGRRWRSGDKSVGEGAVRSRDGRGRACDRMTRSGHRT
ncbi:hypothetical protein K933_14898 [Candidatus Halobonum tyrrellensis G22]|uniref:Uncharacterized protein n=1 Tax=Candidatus Halobonum tyrrellensis G22 TaxID=1324957 RepID=V4HHM4_9EURY|nr:hypothetical protein K933_14898 [Candidatus Halobonum tyrrellensis G22]